MKEIKTIKDIPKSFLREEWRDWTLEKTFETWDRGEFTPESWEYIKKLVISGLGWDEVSIQWERQAGDDGNDFNLNFFCRKEPESDEEYIRRYKDYIEIRKHRIEKLKEEIKEIEEEIG